MKLHKIKISNFRGYHTTTEVEFDNLTALVGQNDAGKSTILEALDYFFNEGKGVIKFDKDDLNVKAKEEGCHEVEISCVFTDLPATLVIDESNATSFTDDYMLNKDSMLEIVKKYKMDTNTAPKATVYLRAYHPSNKECADLLSKTQAQLQKTVSQLGVECADARKNADLRAAIWRNYDEELDLQERLIDISAKSAGALWSKLSEMLPTYSLFQSDRKNSDGDSEVQDPMKEAVKQILKEEEILATLNDVAAKVRGKVQTVVASTLEKLREIDPAVAQTLEPQIPETSELKWVDVFKGMSITGDQNIPINKRGSGVKRLILLNFFRADAERRAQKDNQKDKRKDIIYAIEEPETSQHKNNQKLLIDAFLKLAETGNTQIILTTHSSDVVKRLNRECIRMVKKSEIHKIEDASKSLYPYTSLNEINFLIFDDASVELHDEYYGVLEKYFHKNNQDSFDKSFEKRNYPRSKKWIKEIKKQNTTIEETVTLQTYIRHFIHHPENTRNAKFTEEELAQSIREMRAVWLTLSPRPQIGDAADAEE